MNRKAAFACFLVLGMAVGFAFAAAVQPLEQTAKQLETKVVAPCCWTKLVSYDESGQSMKVRREIRELLAGGKNEQQVLDALVAQYGERILASPKPVGFNIAAYVLPWISLAAGGALLMFVLRRMRGSRAAAEPAPAPMDERYARRLEQELREE